MVKCYIFLCWCKRCPRSGYTKIPVKLNYKKEPIMKSNKTYFLLSLVSLFNVSAQTGLHPDRGVAMIWYDGQENLNDRDGLVTVGQIFYMWRWFEPTEGDYQFDDLDRQLKELSEKGMKATIQINGNVHPDYLFQIVPYLDSVALPSQYDHTDSIGYGPPMYWHETYKEKYSNLMYALADHLRESPYKDVILAVRQSYNAVGTEHHNIPGKYRKKSDAWHREEGVKWGGPWPYTDKTGKDYKRWAINMYIDAFNAPEDFPIFVRASAISNGLLSEKQLSLVEKGDLWLFHTSTEPQPRWFKDDQYKVFVEYCKTGKTYAFMESWSWAKTNDEKWKWEKTNHPITKEQFNYWALLCDLHCGATFPAMRPQDIDIADYRDDYEFASKYAGYLMEPEKAPGAWIAFREGDQLTGDYTYLLERATTDKSTPLYNVDGSKYGLWARLIKAGETMELTVSGTFLQSMPSKATIKIWYKDEKENKIHLNALGQANTVNTTGHGDWKIAVVNITDPNSVSQVRVKTEKDMIVHMVMIEK